MRTGWLPFSSPIFFSAMGNSLSQLVYYIVGRLGTNQWRPKPMTKGLQALSNGLGSVEFVFDDDDVLDLLRTAIEHEGSQIAFAKHHGINRTYLNMVLSGKRPVGDAVAGSWATQSVQGPIKRRFPPPWSVEDIGAAYVAKDSTGQKPAYVYFRRTPAGG
jgi:hypothetical protein